MSFSSKTGHQLEETIRKNSPQFVVVVRSNMQGFIVHETPLGEIKIKRKKNKVQRECLLQCKSINLEGPLKQLLTSLLKKIRYETMKNEIVL